MFRKHRWAIFWLLVVAMILSPATLWCQPPAETGPAPAARPGVDVGYITPDAAAAVVAYPRHILTDPAMEMLPLEVITALGERDFGIDPVQVEQLLAIAEPPQKGPPGAVVVLRLAAPLAEDKLHAPAWDHTEEAQLDGKTYFRGAGPMDVSIFRADDRTVLLGTDPLLRQVLSNHKNPKEGAMSKLLGRVTAPPDAMAIVMIEPLRPLIAMPLASVKWPPQLADLSKVPDLVTSVGAKVNVTGGPRVTLAIRANDEAAAGQLSEIIDKLLATAHERVAEQTAQGLKSSDPVEQAGAKYGQRMSDRLLPLLRPVKKGSNLTLDIDAGKNPQFTSITTIGVLMGLLLPAAQSARGAARKVQSANNMKQIMLAMHNYNSVHGAFPARANFDKQGKPLLSWRVHILPYLEMDAVYQQFHLGEPWDSPHNLKLSQITIPFYQNPDKPSKPGMASYLAVCGKGLAFDGEKGRKFGDFTDGLHNTIMIVEADPDRAVIWTKPDDWEYDAKQPLAGLGNAHPGGFNVGFADGAVRFLSKTIDPTLFHALLTIAGGEPVNSSNLGP